MKRLEIKKVGPGSVFKFCFMFGTVAGLLASIILILAGLPLKNMGIQFGPVRLGDGGFFQVGAAMVGVIIGSIAYGLAAGIIGAIGAALYNILAAIAGGIVIKVSED